MHRSKLQSIVIDCDDIDAGVRFWSEALGEAVAGRDDTYVLLERKRLPIRILLQRVSEPKSAKSRVHLDIESDDIEAEVARLEALGARRRQQTEGWWVMEDPCGNEFCVVLARTPDFAETATVWEQP